MDNCRYPHPKFYLPVDKPAAGPDGKTSDGRELLKLPPPGTVPACLRKELAAVPGRWGCDLCCLAAAPSPALLGLFHSSWRGRRILFLTIPCLAPLCTACCSALHRSFWP